MTPEEHRRAAEVLLAEAQAATNSERRLEVLNTASLHAMLGILGTLLPPPPTS